MRFLISDSTVKLVIPLKDVPSAEAWITSRRRHRSKGGHACDADNYDFDGVSQTELRACVFYEYCRESLSIAQSVDNLRKQIAEKVRSRNDPVGTQFNQTITFKKVTKRHGFHYDAFLLVALAGCTGFPQLGWTKLTQEEKAEMLRMPGTAVRMHNDEFVKTYPIWICSVSQDEPRLKEETINSWITNNMPKSMRHLPPDEMRRWLCTGAFMVNFVHPPDRIVQSFRAWLLKRHPRPSERTSLPRGRNSPRDRLNALGALRLRFYCRTLSEAQTIATPLRNKRYGLYYADRTSWNRACNRAVSYFRQVLDAGESDFPVHQSKGWRK